MKLWAFSFIMLSCALGFASLSGAETLEISPTFRFEVPYRIDSRAYMPDLRSHVFRAIAGDKMYHVIVNRVDPPVLANKYSVKRYWTEMRAKSAQIAITKNERDDGCRRTSKWNFKCHRTSGQDGKFVSETVYWNSKNDLVLLRITTTASSAQVDKAAKAFVAKQDGRSPASRRR